MNNRLKLAPTDDGFEEALARKTTNASHLRDDDRSLEADIAADMERELPKKTAILSGRAAFDKSIAEDIAEEAKLLAIMASTAAKHRQIKSTRRAKEDMRDSMAASEA